MRFCFSCSSDVTEDDRLPETETQIFVIEHDKLLPTFTSQNFQLSHETKLPTFYNNLKQIQVFIVLSGISPQTGSWM